MTEPHLRYDTSKLKNGVNEITVTAFDGSQTEADKKTVTFKVSIIENPLAEVEIKSDFAEAVPLQVAPGATINHVFPISYIKKGNSLKYSINYPEEDAKQHLTADVKEYINYEIQYDKFSGQKGPQVLRSDSAAILFFPKTGEGKEDETSYIQVYRCANVEFSAEECYLVH